MARTPPQAPVREGRDEGACSLPPAQAAACLYAANLTQAAEAVLNAIASGGESATDRQAWLMLFDLFEITNNRAAHDELALRYKLKFNNPPPAWASGNGSTPDPRRAQSRERRDFFVLKPGVAGDLAPEIGKFAAFAQSMGAVRVDLGRIGSITADEAALLAAALKRLRHARLPVWLNNAPSLERVLRAAFNERVSDATRSFWLLLFEIFVLQGDAQSFECLGLEYAITFETTPPGWEIYENRLAIASRAQGASPPPAKSHADIALKGVISAASQDQLADLAARAATLAEIVVDMGGVLRIDFSACELFFGAIKAIARDGRRIILANLSELNAALLEAFGFNRHAILVRRREI